MRIIDLFALQVFAKNLDRCNFRLLQHYLPEADSCTSASRYSISSSASVCKVGGIVKPSVLAVLTLITSSYFDGCNIGRSEGFAPLSIFPT